MRVDAAGPARAAFDRAFDVCVIGAGPAGITLARALADRGLDVALMEAGGLEWSPESQDVYVGENAGLDYYPLDAARLRFFGGTSFHWNGYSRPLDAADFEPRLQNPPSGWPIGRAEFDPFADEAAAILGLGRADFGERPPPAGGRFRQVSYGFSPVRFGEWYLDEITSSERILLGLHANLVDLRLDDARLGDDRGRVTGAVFRGYAPDDPGFTVAARAYCLCTGGIENARLLLNFRDQMPEGIGNRRGLVGRYFAEHPAFRLGEVLFERAGEELTFSVPTEAFLAERATLPLVLVTARPPSRSFLTEFAREVQCNVPFADRLFEAVTGRAPARCDVGGLGAWRRSREDRRAMTGQVFTNGEQALNPESRVTLAEARDAFGMRRARLTWDLQEIDYRSAREAALAFAEDLATQGIGRMRLEDWLLGETAPAPEVTGSWHHMGTTRMSADPRAGVVDADCRVHEVANLYVGGSSVFASTGYANPTFTIVQLALRLADHLDATLAA
jgi:choline dehydrogenase-like flavoprotein